MTDTLKQLDTQKYYISYYDSFDYEWLGWSYVRENRPEWIFSNLGEANVKALELNEALPFSNVRCGEYYDVKEVPYEDLTKEKENVYSNDKE